MAATVEYYEQVLNAFPDPEQLTVLVVAGATRAQVADVLDVDVDAPTEPGYQNEDFDTSGWALVEIPGGVLALEQTGYADPTRHALVELSTGGRAAAVVRNNIQAHLRFGCAQDGQLLFDDDEFMYIEDPSTVPADLRPLFDLVWEDLEQDIDDSGNRPSGFVVGLAMAEQITGVPLTRDQIIAGMEARSFAAPSLVYRESLDE